MFRIRRFFKRLDTRLTLVLLFAGLLVWRFVNHWWGWALIGLLAAIVIAIWVSAWMTRPRTSAVRSQVAATPGAFEGNGNVDSARIVIAPERGLPRRIYERSGQTRVVVSSTQVPILDRQARLSRQDPAPRDQAFTVVNDGPKGGCAKTGTITEVAAANADAGNTTVLVEATLEGSLMDNMGLLAFEGSAKTLWERLVELDGDGKEAAKLFQNRDIRRNPELIVPSMTWNQFRQHTFRTDTGVEVLFQPYETTQMPTDGEEVVNWFTPKRFYAVHAESTSQADTVFVDTGNEATPLKQAALSVADAFLATTTTDTAKVTKTLSCIKRRLLQFGVPIVTVVVNEEDADMSRVLEVMRTFSEFGPVRYVEYVPVIKRTGITQFHPVPLSAQDQYSEIAATFRDLRVKGVSDDFPSGRAFKALRSSAADLAPSQAAAAEEVTEDDDSEESITVPDVPEQPDADGSNETQQPAEPPVPPADQPDDSRVLASVGAQPSGDQAGQTRHAASAPAPVQQTAPVRLMTLTEIARDRLGPGTSERAENGYIGLIAQYNPSVVNDADGLYDPDKLTLPAVPQ